MSVDATLYTPEISVIVPAFNAASWLGDCIDSILAQTFTNWEAIVVDDGSTDNTPIVCNQYSAADSRIRVFMQANAGVSSARNAGIDRSRGKFLLFVDADDLLSPYALELLISTAKKAAADYVIGGITRKRNPRNIVWGKREGATILSGWQAAEKSLYQTIDATSSCGALISKKIFDTSRYCSGRYEDLAITYKLMLKSLRVALLKEKVYFYRQHQHSFIHSFNPGRLDAIKVTEGIINFIREKHTQHPTLQAASIDRHFSACCNAYALISKALSTSHNLGLSYTELQMLQVRIFNTIRSLRNSELRNPRVRLKNRLGALLSFSPQLFHLLSKCF